MSNDWEARLRAIVDTGERPAAALAAALLREHKRAAIAFHSLRITQEEKRALEEEVVTLRAELRRRKDG